MRSFLYVLALTVVFCGNAVAQSTQTPEGLKEYVPVLPSVRSNFFDVDPKLGYAVKSVGGGVYVVSDNMWQPAFLVTQ